MERLVKTLTFKIGEETRPVKLNKDSYKDNLLSAQISKALCLIEEFFPSNKTIVRDDLDDIPVNKTISFLGDRGTGKSSCLQSLVNILTESRKDICLLETVEPAYFDKHRNIMELIIGTMFRKYENWLDEQQDANRHNLLVELGNAFQEVKRDLQYIESDCCQEDSELEDLQGLASSIGLSASVMKLVDAFLVVERKDYMLITIDDIDLNASLAFEMAEQIRKYLILDKVVVCIAGKSEQLSDAIKQSYIHQYELLLKHDQISIDEISAMTEAYMVKFLPIYSRIYMPTQDDYADCRLVIADNTDNRHEYESVKIALLELIFVKTRFLFYNSEGQTSLIVPTNLRELRALMLMLFIMPNYDKKAKPEKGVTNKENKNAFLNYFFNTWTTCLSPDNRIFANLLIKEKEPSVFNHLVINELKRKFKLSDVVSNPSVPDWSILMKESCVNYNLSIGDVTIVMDYVSNTRTDIETRRLLFFIKSLYSIRLYQYYDELTDSLYVEIAEQQNEREKRTPELRNNVLQGVSKLSQLIGGSYYTISGDQVIRPERNPDRTRERGLLEGEEIKKLINEIGDALQDDASKKKLRLAEFLMLISSHYFYTKSSNINNEEPSNSYRERSEVYYTRNLSSAGNIRYDVTAPFFNLIDIKATYNRFSRTIFSVAENCEDSLYRKMLAFCNENKDAGEDGIKQRHNYLSATTIRNMEICGDLYQSMLSNRDKCDEKSMARQFHEFYKGIADYGISSYDYDDDERYEIKLLPFNIISEFLEEISDEELEKFFKKPTVNVDADEFIFLREAEMTFSYAWKAMPKKYKHPDSEQFYRETFHPEARHKYPRAEIVANFRRMINEGKLNPIE